MGALTRNDQRAIAAEFLGTMFFVFLSCGAVVAVGGNDITAIALGHGLALLIIVGWTANVSGGHINPAVTIAMMVTNNIRFGLGIAYIVAQFAGAAVGALLLKLVVPDPIEEITNLGLHRLLDSDTLEISAVEALAFEAIMTGFFVLVIFHVAVSTKGWGINAPIAIGLAIVVVHLVAVPFTGPSVNPARSFGPALVMNEWNDYWVYVVGPGVGALVVAAFWMFWKDFGDDSLQPEMELEMAADEA